MTPLTSRASRTGVASVGFVGFPSVGKVRVMQISFLRLMTVLSRR
jgi:ribosome-interacting GTPase 1